MIREVQEKGISEDELQQLQVKWRSDYYSTLEGGRGGYMPRYGLMHLLACFTLFDNEPQLVNTILDGFLAVKREEVQRAAQKYLRPENRAIVFRTPVTKRCEGGRVMATRAAEVPTLAPALTPERPGNLAEADEGAAVERSGSGPGGSALHSEISRRAVFSRGECAGGGSRSRTGGNDGDGGAHGNGEAREPPD